MGKVWATSELESQLRASGRYIVAGADEVGRGALAGPLVVACVVLDQNFNVPVCDSKMLTRVQRAQLAEIIKAQALDYSLAFVEPATIDRLGLAQALRLGYLMAMAELAIGVSVLLVDGSVNYLGEDFARNIIRGDQHHSCISAASIVAKVARDNHMIKLAANYPEYLFVSNVGYGTPAHRAAIATHGLTDIHRHSFNITA